MPLNRLYYSHRLSHSTRSRFPTHFSTTMTRNNILTALLALITAIEFAYDMGTRIGTWYNTGGREEIIKAVALIITAIVWTVSTARLGAQVVRTNAPVWAAKANDIRNAIGQQFVYAS